MKEQENVMKRLQAHCAALENESININSKRYEVDSTIDADMQTKKRLEKNLNRLNKEKNDSMKAVKKLNHDNMNLENNVKELTTEKESTDKLVAEKKKEIEALEVEQKYLEDEQKIFIGQLVKIKLEDKTMEAKKGKLEKDISAHKQQVLEF